MNEHSIDFSDFTLNPKKLAEIIQLIDNGKISNSTATQKLFPLMLENPDASALELAQQNNLVQDSNSDNLQSLIDQVLLANPSKVKEYQSGKKGLLGMFVGEVMKKSKGSADPKLTNELLLKALQQ